MPNLCRLKDLGLSRYLDVYQEQLNLVEQRKCGKLSEDVLIFTEHHDVYTFGRKSKDSIPPALQDLSFEVERGGEATFHNPGQLVCYPILQLKSDEQDVLLHLRRLEELVIQTLKGFGISSEQREGATGVWVTGKMKKIASIGIAVKSWVTYHGLALNVSNDLVGFGRINPCGFDANVMTSIQRELNLPQGPPLLEVKAAVLEQFAQIFKRKIV